MPVKKITVTQEEWDEYLDDRSVLEERIRAWKPELLDAYQIYVNIDDRYAEIDELVSIDGQPFPAGSPIRIEIEVV